MPGSDSSLAGGIKEEQIGQGCHLTSCVSPLLRDLGVSCGAGTGFILQREPDVVRAPDAAFVASGRIPETGVPVSYWPFAPDLLVEVVSPSDRLADVHVKIADYLASGTRLVWLVEPETRMVHVYRSPQQVEVLGAGDDLDGDDVLPGFQCPVRRLFPSDRKSR